MSKTLRLSWRCSRCREEKPIEDFPAWKRSGRPSYCSPCQREWAATYRESNREKLRVDARRQRLDRISRDPDGEARRDWARALRYKYNLSPDDYERMFAAQDGKCGICRKPPYGKHRFHVDHDHRCCPGTRSCGVCIRGLLCASCNPKLGFFELFEREIAIWRDRRMP